MNTREGAEIEAARKQGVSPRRAHASAAPKRSSDGFYGSIFALAIVGAEVAWLGAIAYIVYRLIT